MLGKLNLKFLLIAVAIFICMCKDSDSREPFYMSVFYVTKRHGSYSYRKDDTIYQKSAVDAYTEASIYFQSSIAANRLMEDISIDTPDRFVVFDKNGLDVRILIGVKSADSIDQIAKNSVEDIK